MRANRVTNPAALPAMARTAPDEEWQFRFGVLAIDESRFVLQGCRCHKFSPVKRVFS